ncbi:Chromate resistance protein ChrB [Actinopolymorpha pittospori]|uniref:ChrB N-terminal domain-containing protein n=1 Tax=Actinopolymorpha pittospori TaxID=648752 RepID=A0A927MXM8_9ACTN|nr:Chromate resistance protein ChrB [Actinopolymorpha pittospori]MBE1608189.1 hypothetical protein [Actinopolymorpha pittospori]
MTDRSDREWLLITVSTGSAGSLRVHVWRTLRKLGAVYLQQSVCLLPDRPPVAKTIARLAARVRDQGGQARVLHIRVTDDGELARLIEQQRAERDAEYGEVVERAPAFLAELEQETARGRTTYAEVEESEADLERFDKWLAKIAARDYFDADGGTAARARSNGAVKPWPALKPPPSPPRPANQSATHPPGFAPSTTTRTRGAIQDSRRTPCRHGWRSSSESWPPSWCAGCCSSR